MYLKIIILAAALLTTFTAFSQNKCFTVLDTLTNEPIPYCNIVLGNNQGFTTNHIGEFCIKSNKEILSSPITVSNISYHQKSVIVNNTDTIIYLNPKHYKLNDININWSKIKFTYLGNKLSKPDSYIHLWRFCQTGIHISALKKNTGIIETVIVPIQNPNEQKVPFRLHIYAADSLMQIGNELLPENVYGQGVDKNYETIEIDVLKYQIKIPENGVFITIELLSNNKPEELQIGTKRYSEMYNNRIGVTEARYQHRKMLKVSSWKLNSFYIEPYPFTNIEGIYGELPMIKVKIRELKN